MALASDNTSTDKLPPIGKSCLTPKTEGQRVERLPGAHLRLGLGVPLSMRLACVDLKYEGKVVGLEPYGYIIVQARLPQDTLNKLTLNNQLVAQVVMDGVVYGFRSQVTNRVLKPAPLFFLSYPDAIERLVLRSDSRVSVSLPGQIHGKFGDMDVMIQDMTNSGCRFIARADMKNPLRDAQPGDEVLLSTTLGLGEKFMNPVVARRVESQHGLVSLGCQFRDLSEEKSKLVCDYVQRIASYTQSLA